jgi:hypothetical protein
MKLITCQQIRDTLKRDNSEVRNIWLFDKHYCALTIEEYEDILKEIQPINVQFKAELFDCEDFAHVTSAFVKLKAASKYPKGVAFGEITIKHTVSKEIHSLNFLVTEDEEMHYYEPQGSLFVNGENYKPFFVRI